MSTNNSDDVAGPFSPSSVFGAEPARDHRVKSGLASVEKVALLPARLATLCVRG